MSHMEDDDPPIRTHPASKEYRDNWDRIFGEKEPCCVCGATDHESVKVFGSTLYGCPEVPDNVMVVLPDPDTLECRMRSAQITEPGFVEACRKAEKPWERRAIERQTECSTCGAKNEAPCDEDIHATTGQPIER